MPIEVESPEEQGYGTIRYNLGESSVRDGSIAALGGTLLDDLAKKVLWYGDHRGEPELRELIAAQTHSLKTPDVLVTTGAAMALFIVHAAFLKPGDEAVVFHPNYGTNLETPRALGAKVLPLNLTFKDSYRPDLDRLESMVSTRTRLISITDPHNPTGITLNKEEREHIIRLAERRNCVLLVDETYRDLTHGEALPWAADQSTNAISVSSLSKSYGLPGIRVGWALTRNQGLAQKMLAVKEQMVICGSILDETVAVHALRQRTELLTGWRSVAAKHLGIVGQWISAHQQLECVRPEGGVVCFPRLRNPDAYDVELFHRHLREQGETFVGPGHWFDVDRRHFRLGFGWPTEQELHGGLAAIDSALLIARCA
jgi:aspartate/methionine/tyrosine aminotransferase